MFLCKCKCKRKCKCNCLNVKLKYLLYQIMFLVRETSSKPVSFGFLEDEVDEDDDDDNDDWRAR